MTIFDNPYMSEHTREILEKYDVEFVFQPIYSRFGTIAAYEALMRPRGKFILDFIDENVGVQVALDDFGTGFNDEKAVEYYNPQMIKMQKSRNS